VVILVSSETSSKFANGLRAFPSPLKILAAF